MALCRVHHNECHNIGHKTFEDKYKIIAIKLNEVAIKELRI
ncbi:putative HNHc nuclease [uncultured Turicibacter sp.]